MSTFEVQSVSECANQFQQSNSVQKKLQNELKNSDIQGHWIFGKTHCQFDRKQVEVKSAHPQLN